MTTTDFIANQRGFIAGLSVRRKLGIVVLLALIGAFVIDPGSSDSSDSHSASTQAGADGDDFAEMDALLASLENDTTPPAAETTSQRDASSESEDSESWLTLDESSTLTVPEPAEESTDVPVLEVSHAHSELIIPMQSADGDSVTDSGRENARSHASIRLTGTIYPVRQPLQ